NGVTVTDRLPVSFHYAAGSGVVTVSAATGQSIEPEIRTDDVLFRLGEIPHGATTRLLYRVRVGANAHEGNQENLAIAAGVFPTGEHVETTPASAAVFISAGVFSTRQLIVGRVFVDANGNGQFDATEKPAPGIRLYLNNGQSVITDSAGLYNFPSLGDGPQVISIDPVSVPKGYALADGGRVSGKSWTRLLRTPIGGGALLRQNFALVDTDKLQLANDKAAGQKNGGASRPLAGEVGERVPGGGPREANESALPTPTPNASSAIE